MFKKLLNIGKSHHHHPSSTTTSSEKPTSSSTSMLTVDDLNGSNTSGSIIVRTNGTSTPANNVTMNGPEVSQFVRAAHNRMSLPIMQQNKIRRQAYSQLQRRGTHVAPPRSLGHIYLQHKGETKQATLPNELTTIDTIRALFVCAFPHLLTMEFMSQPFVKIYIYNPNCNIFYELCDIEDVKHESVLRIHQSDPMSLSMAPVALPVQHHPQVAQPVAHSVSMASMQSHYATLSRMTPRPPQVPAPPPPHQPAPLPPHMMQPAPQMLNSSFHQGLNQSQHNGSNHLNHHYQHPQQQQFNHLPRIPPPKPRRMIPSGYSMHHIDSPSQ